jgi:hypothetical protein
MSRFQNSLQVTGKRIRESPDPFWGNSPLPGHPFRPKSGIKDSHAGFQAEQGLRMPIRSSVIENAPGI